MSKRWVESDRPRKDGHFTNATHTESDYELEPVVPSVEISPEGKETTAAWNALIDLAGEDSASWVLVGGQAAYIRSIESGVTQPRMSTDVDIVLDARGHLHEASQVNSVLHRLGFTSSGADFLGRTHRYVRDGAQIDILQPRFMGLRAENALKKNQANTIPAPGAQHAIDRSAPVRVLMYGRTATFRCPIPLGIVVAKSGAYLEIAEDDHRERHLLDIAGLAEHVSPYELRENPLSSTERSRIRQVLNVLTKRTYFTEVARERLEFIVES